MGTKSYERLKDPEINTTGMDITFEGSELPTARAALAAGTVGDAEIFVEVDADESAGVDKQDLYQVKLVPIIDAAHPGGMRLTIEATPVLGGGGLGTKEVFTLDHPETMDAWQVAAGRPRQV